MSNEKHNAGIQKMLGVILIFLGLMISMIGISGLLHTTWDFIGWVMLALTLSGILMLTGGLFSFMAAKDSIKVADEIQQTITSANAKNTIPTSLNYQEVLAHWKIDNETWSQFKKNEIRYRNSDNIYFFIAFVLLGGLTIMINRGADWKIALLISVIMGSIIVAIRRNLALKKLTTTTSQNEVYITRSFIVLNGDQYILFSENRKVSKVELIATGEPLILSYTVHWPTRNGTAFDELRIPVPENAITLAQKICDNFNLNS